MIVWVAQETFLYEGSNIIGVYSDETKAMQACEGHWRERHDRKLEWKQGEAVGSNEHHIFEVGRYEVNK